MRIRDWSSDVGSSDLFGADVTIVNRSDQILRGYDEQIRDRLLQISMTKGIQFRFNAPFRKVEKKADGSLSVHLGSGDPVDCDIRSEEHTSELQSLLRISYAVFCLNKKTKETRDKQRMHS